MVQQRDNTICVNIDSQTLKKKKKKSKKISITEVLKVLEFVKL